MRRKTRFFALVCFMLAATASFGAQSEIVAQFRLPQEAAHLMDKGSWDGLYERVIETLPDEQFAPGRILFKLEGSPNVYLWAFDPKADMAQMLAYVKNLPNVEYCQPDYIYTLEPNNVTPLGEMADAVQTQNANEQDSNQPNDPYYKSQVHLEILGMKNLFETYGPDLKRLAVKGHDPYIHIVDSGGGCEHPDLNRANIILKKDYVDWDDDPCSSPNGMSPHGEFVAAIMCSVSNNSHGGAGICPPNTKLFIWRVFDKDGQAFSSAINIALSQIILESSGLGNEIVNMSFGGPYEDPLRKFFIVVGSAPSKQFGRNITFIAASGNNGDQTLNYPAAFKETISAGAAEFPLAETGEVVRADYSSYGKIDIMAPVGGLSQDNDKNGTPDAIFVEGRTYDKDGKNPTLYGAYFFWGTSGAAPVISGVAASLVNMGVYGPTAIRKALTEMASDIPPLGYDKETGWGMVRADVAVMSVDYSLLVFGSFSQNNYACAKAPSENACNVTLYYTFRTNGRKIYLWDNYSNSLRDLGNNGSSGKVIIAAKPGDKFRFLLLYYPDGGVEPSGNPSVIASAVVTGKALSFPPNGSLSGKDCTLVPGDSSCVSAVTYKVTGNGWNVYIWDSTGDSWSNTAIYGSGTKTATVKSGSATYIRLFYCSSNNGTLDNCLGKIDLPAKLDLNANPAPPPTALLVANGAADITVSVGSTINYLWSSSNADSANSSYTSACGSGPWVANTLFGYTSAVVAPSQTGCTYIISYLATQSPTGKTASATITVRVK